MGFNAAEVLEPLDYDFTSFNGPDGKPLPKGTVPEPSSGAVKAYFRAMKDLAKEARRFKDIEKKLGNIDEISDEELAERMATVDEAEEGADELQRNQKVALAGLCSDNPSLEVLEALPFRIFMAFNKWLIGEINPKTAAPGSKP